MPDPHTFFSSGSADPQSRLLASSLDFIVSAAEFASIDEERSWKYAILHLWNGMELLLKARLAQEHWSLLFADVDRAEHSKLLSGDFISVGADRAHKRLKQICGVEVAPDDWKHLIRLRNLSNRIKHYVGEYNSFQAKSIVWKGMNIGITFCEAQQMLGESREIQGQIYRINTLMQEFAEFVGARLESIATYQDFEADVECMGCWQEACIMDASGIVCQFCGLTIDAGTLNQWLADSDYELSNGDGGW